MKEIFKTCKCGCGKPTKRIWYIGHANKGKKHTEEHKKKCSQPLEKNGRWKGGKMIDRNGYVLIKNRQHPYANNCGYVREHRIIMEQHIGRYLQPNEVIHHKNHVKDDNRIENLMLLNNASEHNKECRTGRKYPRKNIVWFTCQRCHKKFYRSAYWKNKVVLYCSWSCRYPNTAINHNIS